MEGPNPELESFRRQWQEEVSSRSRGKQASEKSKPSRLEARTYDKGGRAGHRVTAPPSGEKPSDDDDHVEDLDVGAYHDVHGNEDGRTLGDQETTVGEVTSKSEPQSALEHYEKAVERETQGNLGDSLTLYRRAYRLDSGVDKSYKAKHFPPSSFASKPTNTNPSNAPVTVPNPAHHSLEGLTPSIAELLPEFAKLSIPAAEPPTDHSPQPSCPIALLPSEMLIEVLLYTAMADIASFARFSRVCKRFAYLISTEERIWRRICCGTEFGFGGMYYRWSCDVFPTALNVLDSENVGYAIAMPVDPHDPLTLSLLETAYSSSWRQMFRTRPRVRFNGCYISTINYPRPGASSPTQISWNTPVHIVTYYRYLRFFRDGTAVSLVTTAEPPDVVYHLTKDNIHSHHTGALPSAVMRHALRGRWRLSGPQSGDSVEREGDLYVETQGVTFKYMNRMHFSLRSSGRGARNTKLAWKGFWNYNLLTDDWAEFDLRNNNQAFVWSRVKSYGMGE